MWFAKELADAAVEASNSGAAADRLPRPLSAGVRSHA
jgi:hypothetical protein